MEMYAGRRRFAFFQPRRLHFHPPPSSLGAPPTTDPPLASLLSAAPSSPLITRLLVKFVSARPCFSRLLNRSNLLNQRSTFHSLPFPPPLLSLFLFFFFLFIATRIALFPVFEAPNFRESREINSCPVRNNNETRRGEFSRPL